MKKLICFLGLAMLVSGCATLDSFRSANRESLMKLSLGMSKAEAIHTMGTGKGTVYTTNQFGEREAITVTNPYRSEILQGKDKTFEVLYYLTDKRNEGTVIPDDALTPLVFDNGKLIGWGQSFLNDNIQKYEIRIR